MKIIRKIEDYVNDNKYKIIIMENKINIVNFDEIIDFNNEEIIIKNKDNITSIKGDSLIINKVYENELLISGKINNIKL